MQKLICEKGVFETFPRPMAKVGHVVVELKSSLLAIDGTGPVSLGCAGIIVEQEDSGFGIGDKVACLGDHADYLLLPRNLCAKVPEKLSFEEAAYIPLGAFALQAVRRLSPKIGDTVAVQGLGLLGQLCCQLLKASGCMVYGTDHDEEKVLFLNRHSGIEGASKTIQETVRKKTGGAGVDHLLVTEEVEPAWDLCKDDGNVVLLATSAGMSTREVTVRTCVRDDSSIAELMVVFSRLCSQGTVQLKPFIMHTFPFDKAKVALGYLAKEKNFGALLLYESAQKDTLFSSKPQVSGEIQVAVIGAGQHANTVQLPLLKKISAFGVKTVVSQKGQSAKEAADRFHIPNFGTNYQEVLEDHDLIFICTRNNMHGEIVKAAAAKGRSVFCEMPLALTEEELKEIAAAKKSFIMAGCSRRFSPLIIKMQEALAKESGPTFITYSIVKDELPDWLLDRKEGGGIIIGEFGPYVDLLNALVGVDPVEVVVRGVGQRQVAALMKYSDGSLATLNFAFSETFPVERLELHKNGVSMVLEDFQELSLPDTVFTLKKPNLGRNAMLEYLADVLTGKREPSFGAREAMVATLACIKMDDSLRSGTPQRLDLDWLAR